MTEVQENNKNVNGVAETYVTKYAFDILGNLIKIIDSENNVRNIKYDWLGRKIEDDLGQRKFIYDVSGKFEDKILSGQILRTNFDVLGRKISQIDITNIPKTVDNKWFYDSCSNSQNAMGKLCMASSTDGVIQKYSYNNLGQMEKQETIINKNTNNNKVWLPTNVNYFKYDLVGNLLEQGSGTATTSYALNKNVINEINFAFGTTSNKVFANANYNDFNQLIKYNRGDLLTENIYDESKLNRLVNINSNFAKTSNILL